MYNVPETIQKTIRHNDNKFSGVLLALHIQLLPTQLDESGETITLEGFGKNQILGPQRFEVCGSHILEQHPTNHKLC